MASINLDKIIDTVAPNNQFPVDFSRKDIKSLMLVAIHQVLVLASEKATTVNHYEGNTGSEYCDTVVDKQSILDVEKLIV